MAIKNILYKEEEYAISYMFLNTNKNKTILFLHGWGANKDFMQKCFKNTFSDFCHIYIDLPGFGHSSINKPLNSVDIKNILEIFLTSINKKPMYIFGHSFGGKIATLLNPERLVLLSSAGIILPKKIKTRIKIRVFKCLKAIGFGSLYRFFVTKDVDGLSNTMYEMLKIVIKEDFSVHFKNFKNKAYIFWGKDDDVTPLNAGIQIHNLIKNSLLFAIEGDHFFFIDNATLIEKNIVACENK